MKIAEAIKKIRVLQNDMNTAADQANAAGLRYSAHMELFNAACKLGDKDEAEKQRTAIHAQVDAILDAGHIVHGNQRELDAIVRSHPEE